MNRYAEIRVQTSKSGTKYRSVNLYPDSIPTGEDIYVISSEGDRFDTLAWEFYNNVDYWWIIAVANPEVPAAAFRIKPGIQMRIPAYPEQYLVEYRRVNS